MALRGVRAESVLEVGSEGIGLVVLNEGREMVLETDVGVLVFCYPEIV